MLAAALFKEKDSEIDAGPMNSNDGDGYETGPIVNILLCLGG